MPKPHILWYGDSPTAHSGFGTVSRSIIERLMDRYDFTCFGINETGQPHEFPFHIIPAFTRLSGGELYGRSYFLNTLRSRVMDYDMVFMMQDHFILSSEVDGKPFVHHVAEACASRNIPMVLYFPVDGIPRKEWLHPLRVANAAVTYTNWALEECKKACPELAENLMVIPHGADLENYEEYSERRRAELRKTKLGQSYTDDRFVVTFVGQNQRRKILDWTLFYAAEMARVMPEFLMLLHTQHDSPSGWRVGHLMESTGVTPDNVRVYADGGTILSLSDMCDLYNASDAFLLPSAEGWGLPVTEAMTCGVPTIVGNHAALSEIGADGRSLRINCPDDPNFLEVKVRDNEVVRRRPDINHAVRLTLALRDNYEQTREELSARCRPWLDGITWDRVAESWNQVFGMCIKASKDNPIEIIRRDKSATKPMDRVDVASGIETESGVEAELVGETESGVE